MGMKSYAFIAAAAAIGALMGGAQNANAGVVRCDYCLQDSEFVQRAKGLGPGTHMVYNLHDNVMQTWRIPYGTLPENPQRVSAAAANQPTKVGNPPEAVNELDKAHKVYVLAGNTLRPIFVVPVQILNVYPSVKAQTIITLIRDNNAIAQIESAVGDPALTSDKVGGLLTAAMTELKNMLSGHLNLKEQASVIFRVVMSDGGYMDFTVTLTSSVADANEASARTQGGQLVPQNAGQLQATWTDERGDNLAALVPLLTSLGASTQNTGGGNHVKTIVCTAAGGVTVCVVDWVQI